MSIHELWFIPLKSSFLESIILSEVVRVMVILEI
jgi:hypothetical protein